MDANFMLQTIQNYPPHSSECASLHIGKLHCRVQTLKYVDHFTQFVVHYTVC